MAEFLGMTLWFSATAVTPALVAEFHMSDELVAWLTMAVQAGFVAGTLASALLNLADVLNARVLLFLGALAGAAANASVLLASSASGVIALRFLTGVALACVYPPGMKIAAGWFRAERGFALGIVIGALTLGKAFPHLLTALYGHAWREPMLLASGLAVAGGTLVSSSSATARSSRPAHPSIARAIGQIFRNRGARLATLGYLGHMWELYAMWTWIAVLASASFAASGSLSPASEGSIAAFRRHRQRHRRLRDGGWLADRLGRARIAIWAMWTSACCAALTPLVFGGSPLWFLRARDDLGLRGRRRLRAVLRARHRILADQLHRHRADPADVPGLPADDGHHRVAAARRRSQQLALGVPPPRSRSVLRDSSR
jgi:MFS family permease